MAKYIDAEKLKAEIEAREKVHFEDYHIKKSGNPADYGAANALTQLLSFIESLEKEQDVGLEKEIEEYTLSCEGALEGQQGQSWEFDWEDITMVIDEAAHHFYELGLNSKSDTPKIKGWVARDQLEPMCKFHIGPKPKRFNEDGLRYWVGGICWNLPKDMFSDLKWEDEPVEVELIINRV